MLEVRFRLLCIQFASFSDAVFCIAGHSHSMITDALLHLLAPCCLSAQEPVFRCGTGRDQGSHDNGDEECCLLVKRLARQRITLREIGTRAHR